MVKHQWITKSAQRIKKQKKNMLPWGKKKKKKFIEHIQSLFTFLLLFRDDFEWEGGTEEEQ